MLNKKGFTLIELIATIALLAVIAVISFISITRVIEKNKIQNCQTLVDSIITATNEYVSDNRYTPEFVNGVNEYHTSVVLQELVENDYFNGDLVNPNDKSPIIAENVSVDIYLNPDYSMLAAYITDTDLQNCNTKYRDSITIENVPSQEVIDGDKEAPVITYNPDGEAARYREEIDLMITATDAASGVDYLIVETYDKNGNKVESKSVSKIKASAYSVHLEEGTWRVVTYAYDYAGNKGEKDKTFVVDLGIATPVIDNPSGGKWTNKAFKLTMTTTSTGINNWQYTYSADATNDEYTVTAGSNAETGWVKWGSSNKSKYVTSEYKANIDKEIFVRACSKTRCSEKVSTNLRFDKTIPTVSYSEASTWFETNNKSITITASDTFGEIDYMMVHVYKNDTFVSEMSTDKVTASTYTVKMNDYGTWNIYVKVFDKAGNMQNQKPKNSDGWYYQTYELLVPMGIPSIDNPTGGNWTNSNFKLKLSIVNTGITNWQYTYKADADTKKTGTDATKNWVKYSSSAKSNFTTTISDEINKTIYVRACDAHRCSEKASTVIRLDKTRPKVSYSWPENTYPDTLGYTAVKVTDKGGSGIDYWNLNVHFNAQTTDQNYNLVRDTDTIVAVLNGAGFWAVCVKAVDNAGNVTNARDPLTDGWTYASYTLGASSGGGGGGSSGGGCSGSCSFTIDNGYSGGSTTCSGTKVAPNEGGCVCVGCGTQQRLW